MPKEPKYKKIQEELEIAASNIKEASEINGTTKHKLHLLDFAAVLFEEISEELNKFIDEA